MLLSSQQFSGSAADGNVSDFHELSPVIEARYIRFRPTSPSICLRVELYGTPGINSLSDRFIYNGCRTRNFAARSFLLQLKSGVCNRGPDDGPDRNMCTAGAWPISLSESRARTKKREKYVVLK